MNSPNSSSGDLPPVITAPYPHISIGDLYEVANAIDPSIQDQDTAPLEAELSAIKREFAPADSTFYHIGAATLSASLEAIAEEETQQPGKRIGVVHLDKYIGADSPNPDFFRLNLSRDSNNTLVARAGTSLPPEQQLTDLATWAAENAYQELLLVDDVLAFGTTIPPIVANLRQQLPDIRYRLLAGIAASGGVWRGIERVKEETGIDTEYLTKAYASPAIKGGSKGMAIPVSRGLTLFGGKTGMHETGRQLSYPYFLPFTPGMTSVMDSGRRTEAAERLLVFNADLFRFLGERLARAVTIGDLIDKGFGYPHTSLARLQDKMAVPPKSTEVGEYIEYAQGVMRDHSDIITREVVADSDKK